jgi:rhodanese-related sulfurtransferase
MSPLEAAAFMREHSPVVIDIRTPDENELSRLAVTDLLVDYLAPGFSDSLAHLNRDVPYLIYCRSGRRSGLALGIMRGMGFTDAHDIRAGIIGWKAAGLPVES